MHVYACSPSVDTHLPDTGVQVSSDTNAMACRGDSPDARLEPTAKPGLLEVKHTACWCAQLLSTVCKPSPRVQLLRINVSLGAQQRFDSVLQAHCRGTNTLI
jgi:hypothetical protein